MIWCPRGRIIVAAKITPRAGNQTYRIAKVGRLLDSVLFGEGVQHRDLNLAEQHRGGKFRAGPPQQGHEHDAPGDDQVDRNGALESLGAVVCEILDAASGLEHPMPVSDAPAQAIPAQTGLRVVNRVDGAGGQQEPLQRLCILRR